MADAAFPVFPPGFWRRIEVHPQPGSVSAGVEDDVHRFHVRIAHRDGTITRVDTEEPRVPYTTCPGAGAFLRSELTGRRLDDIARLDAKQHCTHLFDIAVLAVRLVEERALQRFDIRVGDRIDERTTATLSLNDVEMLRWYLEGTSIVGPKPWSGRELRQLSRWESELSPRDALHARLLRMGAMVSNARQSPPVERATDLGPGRLGACFTHSLPRALEAVRASTERRDFSQGGAPLADFTPERIAMSGDLP
jgi:hypothetical protein